MGRWIELKDKKGNVICETTPHPLLQCVRYLPKQVRSEFPILNDLDLHSGQWIDEVQTLNPTKAKDLKIELKRIRRLTQFDEFISGVDNQSFYDNWKDGEDEAEFNQHLDLVEHLIQIAIEKQLAIRVEL